MARFALSSGLVAPCALLLLSCTFPQREAVRDGVSPTAASCDGTVEELARCLTEHAAGDRQKAWAIYRWIALNISYDMEAYRDGVAGPAEDPETVLRRHAAVCEGFSDLFVTLARSSGLEAATISGHAKGLGYQAGDSFEGLPDNHAWNAVTIDGRWQLLDCTWGAGAVDADGAYRQRFEPYYFLPPPEEFLLTHLPSDPKWQLVEPSIRLTQFEKLPYVKAPFFRCGLRVKSHGSCVIEPAGRSVAVELAAPSDAVLLGKLIRGVSHQESWSVPSVRRAGLEIFKVVLPKAGTYTLRIFAARGSGRPGDTRALDWAIDYTIVAR
jgi:transglutaminase/protease-like cytokinesis protein 3